MQDREDLENKLNEYIAEHTALNNVIDRLLDNDQPVNLFEMTQLKKKKLWLKDMIEKMKSDLIDDIIA